MSRFLRSTLFLVSMVILLSCVPANTNAESIAVSMPSPAMATASQPASVQRTSNPTETQAQQLAGENDIFLPVVTEEVANPQPALTVSKTVTSSGSYELNSNITYSIVVKNTGNITLTGVTITDPGAVINSCTPNIPAFINPGNSVTCTATHTVTQADLNRGYFTNTATADSNQTGVLRASVRTNFSQNPVGLIADHRVLDEFESIPRSFIDAAEAKDILYYHASTGGYIDYSGFRCLNGQKTDPTHYPQEDCLEYAQTPGLYNIANWSWMLWPSGNAGDALGRTAQFTDLVDSNQQNYEIIGFKFCYLDGWNIDFENYRTTMEDLENRYPNKTFIWATPALYGEASPCGSSWHPCENIANFNVELRAYAQANNKPLFDISAIESDGGRCQVGGYEGLCPEYYDGYGGGGGGHPDPDGSIRLAKGFWWLMAKLSGWN